MNKEKIPPKDKPIISLTTTLDRFRKDKHKEITLQDLRQEINQIKINIKELKKKDKSLDEEIAVLKINKSSL